MPSAFLKEKDECDSQKIPSSKCSTERQRRSISAKGTDGQSEFVFCDPKNASINCGQEAACLLRDKTYRCVCVQDLSDAKPHRACSLKTDPPSTSNSKKIEVSVQQQSTVAKTDKPQANPQNQSREAPLSITPSSVNSSSQDSESKIIIITATLVISLLLTILIWRCIRCISIKKQKKQNKDKAFAIPLRKNILTEERYTTNPHYTSAGSTSDSCIPIVPIISRSAITDLQKIGEGFFGKVYKGQLHVNDDNGVEKIETVAVKMLKHTTNLEAEEDFMREVEIMSSFEHTNILTLIGLCPRENTLSPWMVFEFMPLGDLASVLRKSSLQFWSSVPTLPALSSDSLLLIASQISEGMEYLAGQRFVHRDLACRNCLVGSDLVVKIADFGMSRDVYTCDYYKIGGTRMLPVRWMAPESIVYGRFTLESDVWSYGVVLWEIYSYGKQPYYGHSNEEVLKFILDGILLSIPDDCSEDIADIMKACWRKDIKERIMFSEICVRLSKLRDSINQQNIAALPRPPPLPVSIDHPALMVDKTEDDDTDDEGAEDLLDEDDYLRPISRSDSVFSGEYIEPIQTV